MIVEGVAAGGPLLNFMGSDSPTTAFDLGTSGHSSRFIRAFSLFVVPAIAAHESPRTSGDLMSSAFGQPTSRVAPDRVYGQ
jgi:hypothetical protein